MRDFQKNKSLKRTLHSKVFLVFLGVIIVFFSYNIFGFVNKMKETEKNKQIVKEKLTSLEKSKEKLNADIAKLNTEGGVEARIREKFGLAKEGDGMILIVEEEKPNNTEEKEHQNSFLYFFSKWFK